MDKSSLLEQQVLALIPLLDRDLTKEYRHALEVVPDLVRRESKVADFLRREQGNAWNTACRLSRYWKTRKSIFGDRWLLPMVQTGRGALRDCDVEILRSGGINIATCPRLDCTVCMIDYTRFPRSLSSQVHVEVQFYLATIYPNYMVFLMVVRRGDRPNMTVTGQYRDILAGVAMQVKGLVVAQVYEEGREHLLDFLGFQQRRVAENNLSAGQVLQIQANSMRDTWLQLHTVGFDQSCLPIEFGGSIGRENLEGWIRMRLSIEESMGDASLQAGARLGQLVPSVASLAPAPAPAQGYSLLTRRPDETDEAFLKRKNAAYARRSYHRKNIAIRALQEEIDGYEIRNDALKKENEKLERYLKEVHDIVGNYMSGLGG